MPARPVRPLLLLAVLLFASASGAQVDSPASGSPTLEVDVGTDTVIDLDDAPEPDPCAMQRGVEFLGLDWSRRQLHHGICATVALRKMFRDGAATDPVPAFDHRHRCAEQKTLLECLVDDHNMKPDSGNAAKPQLLPLIEQPITICPGG